MSFSALCKAVIALVVFIAALKRCATNSRDCHLFGLTMAMALTMIEVRGGAVW
jgi:hypothetical protein